MGDDRLADHLRHRHSPGEHPLHILNRAPGEQGLPQRVALPHVRLQGRNYQKAAELYRELVEEKPLARNHAFLGAALGASERLQESVDSSTEAIKKDPKYGFAYYNRALVLHRMGKKSRAVKDLKQALEADLHRRFRTAARKMLEELT